MCGLYKNPEAVLHTTDTRLKLKLRIHLNVQRVGTKIVELDSIAQQFINNSVLTESKEGRTWNLIWKTVDSILWRR